MDTTRVDQIVQFALARAAHEDDWKLRSLGPIHLIKYVYLADLAFARSHNGETFTGVAWEFFHYGPWSSAVHERIEPATVAIHAHRSIFESSKYEKDIVRYSLDTRDAADVERNLGRGLPFEVSSAVNSAVKKFGNDTSGLLDWVYRTPPMLVAAPKERLDFSVAKRDDPLVQPAVAAAPSRRQEKKMETALLAARQAFKERLATLKAADSIPPQSAPPRYDDVFAEGSAWLDSEGVVEPLRGEVHFPDDIWKSGWRDPHGGQ